MKWLLFLGGVLLAGSLMGCCCRPGLFGGPAQGYGQPTYQSYYPAGACTPCQ